MSRSAAVASSQANSLRPSGVVGDTGDTATSNDVAKGGHDTEYAQGAKYGEYETDEAFRAIQARLGRCDFGVKVARIERIEEVVWKLLVGD